MDQIHFANIIPITKCKCYLIFLSCQVSPVEECIGLSCELVLFYRLLKALGASSRTRIYWAGGEPLGKELALQPLTEEFPNLFNKESLATPEELQPFKKKASILAAIDYLVCLNSDVFLQSHGGNFGRVMQVSNKRHHISINSHFSIKTKQNIIAFFTTRSRHLSTHDLGKDSIYSKVEQPKIVTFLNSVTMYQR